LDNLLDFKAEEKKMQEDPLEMPDLNLTFKSDTIKNKPKKCVEMILSMVYSKCCRKQDFNQLMKEFDNYSKDWLKGKESEDPS